MKFIESFINVNKWHKLIVGTLVCVLTFLLVYTFNVEELFVVQQTIIYLAIPGAYALIGLAEIVSGVPFIKMSGEWDNLSGWQRGLLGIFIVTVFFFLFMFGIVAFA